MRGIRFMNGKPMIKIDTRDAVWVVKVTIDGDASEAMTFMKERINFLVTPFEREWRRISRNHGTGNSFVSATPTSVTTSNEKLFLSDEGEDRQSLRSTRTRSIGRRYFPSAVRNSFFADSTSRAVCWLSKMARSFSP